jgi:hypothetical protein
MVWSSTEVINSGAQPPTADASALIQCTSRLEQAQDHANIHGDSVRACLGPERHEWRKTLAWNHSGYGEPRRDLGGYQSGRDGG